MTSYDNLGDIKEKMPATTARGRMHAVQYGGDASHEKSVQGKDCDYYVPLGRPGLFR